MEGRAQKCFERCCELANKKGEQLYKVSSPCLDDHHFKKEELESVGELSKVCSQIVLKCLYLARIGRPDVLWSVNKLARSVTKWTGACDNEAVIKMISKGRSPTMRHVSRATESRLIGCLTDQLGPNIQNKYVDTKHQLAGILTKGNFTRDEWKHLLRLFNIMSFSVFSCSHIKSIQDHVEGAARRKTRVVTKTRPMISLVSKNATRMDDSCVSNSPKILGMQCGSSGRSFQHWETSCERWDRCEWKHRIEFSSLASECKHSFPHWETSCENAKQTQRNKADPSQFPNIQCQTFRETCSRMYDRNWVVLKGTKCWTSKSMGWSWESSCQRWCRRQFISDQISKKICVQPRRQSSSRWKTLFEISQSLILNHKSEIYGISTTNGTLLHGWDRLCYMTEQSSCRKQRYMSALIPCLSRKNSWTSCFCTEAGSSCF